MFSLKNTLKALFEYFFPLKGPSFQECLFSKGAISNRDSYLIFSTTIELFLRGRSMMQYTFRKSAAVQRL